ncbi:type II toxin-antitoxin system VapC family toxin [Scytonema sp. NUACC26]|uniref:type II toxin-antitoxin system VapC family toxin n=1 Tax=Scytonema sp. NUACC26 TaxID=3140176 RepID=UPI0034DBB0DD
MYLLDTNHCTFIIEGRREVIERWQDKENVQVSTSVIVAGELKFMAQNSQERTTNLLKVNVFIQRINVYPINLEIAAVYAEFKTELVRRFGPKQKIRRRTTKLGEIGISEHDLWIAATAIRYSLTVVSTDSDFERMQQVREFNLESWV